MTLPAAVHKMTGMPAQRFGLAERGLIREGYWADLVLFDAERIRDTATYTDPVHVAEGIAAVWVNGELTYTSAGTTGARAGCFVARGRTAWVQ
jgi:N-acyl-D-aspartate/D-glutamate deacylase